MSQPTLSQVHVNVPLSNLSIAYAQDENEFAADKVFPIVPVPHKSDIYYVIPRDAFMRNDVKERAAGAESEGTGFNVDASNSFLCKVYALHQDIPEQVDKNADYVLQLDMAATRLITSQHLINRETKFINAYFQNGVWTGGVGGGDLAGVAAAPTSGQFLQWDQGGSTPITDIRNAALTIKSRTGQKPNVLVLGPYTFEALLNHPTIVDRIKYTQLGIVDMDLLAKVLGMGKVVVPGGVQNTAPEGLPGVFNFIYGKGALLAYAAPAPGIMVPSAGYIFSWAGYLNGGATMAISRWWDQNKKSFRIEGETSFDIKVVGTDLGVYFGNAIS